MITDSAYEKAIEVLEKCATSHGFNAAFPGYDALWSRDSMITSLGASVLGDKFKTPFKNSIEYLAKHQSKNGQIPNAVDIWSKERKPHVDYLSIDSSIWFVIGINLYAQRYKDKAFKKKYQKQIDKAMFWLACQDTSEDGMPEQQPNSDWQDAFPHRYGHTINTQALYYKALMMEGKKKEANKLSSACNHPDGVNLWNGKYYLPWRWKNHNKYHEKGEWFDSLGNLLAIVFDLAPPEYARKILAHIEKNKIAQPFPIRTIDPPIRPGTKDWYDYFEDCGARTPYEYSNGGIWTFIGGFYVLALLKHGKTKEAQKALEKIAEANMLANGNYSEWLHGKTGEPATDGGNQAWNAGMYVLAYESLKKGKVLI